MCFMSASFAYIRKNKISNMLICVNGDGDWGGVKNGKLEKKSMALLHVIKQINYFFM